MNMLYANVIPSLDFDIHGGPDTKPPLIPRDDYIAKLSSKEVS